MGQAADAVWRGDVSALAGSAWEASTWVALHRYLAGLAALPEPLELCSGASAALAMRAAVARLVPPPSWAGNGTSSSWEWVAQAWGCWCRGEFDPSSLDRVGRRAAEERDAALVIEVQAVRALILSEQGDIEAGLSHARTAARMATSEAFPQQEYLAYLTLARLRRVSGRPHLATRILASLARVAPPAYAMWLRWEQLLAGAAPSLGRSPLDDLLMAVGAGEAQSIEDRARVLHQDLAGLEPMRHDLAELRQLIDPSHPPGDWGTGDAEGVPRGLHAVRCSARSFEEDVSGVVLVGPGIVPRRYLAVAEAVFPNAVRLGRGHRRRGRLDVALAILALAGESGLTPERLFERAYQFPYDSAAHESTFRMMLMRARRHLKPHAGIQRSGARLTLLASGLLLLPDPRSRPPFGDRVLQILAEAKSMSANAAAEKMGVPLRRVQAELQQLVSEGACACRKDGRAFAYDIEDTVFSDPTTRRHRLSKA